jgi:hypothetical protein
VDIAEVQSTERFDDPIVATEFGADYEREWIAAIEPVMRSEFRTQEPAGQPDKQDSDTPSAVVTKKANETPNSQNGDRIETGLYVLAAEDYQAAIRPVRELGDRLVQLAVLAVIFFLSVAVAMWLLVMRMLRESRQSRVFAPSGDSSMRANE